MKKADLSSAKRILFAPLNWGLGHATRSMVIIDQAISENKRVAIASDGIALKLLKEEYKDRVDFYDLPSYNIKYSHASFMLSMVLQAPKILRGIKAEQQVLKSIIENWKPDLIVSDNRYGIHHNHIKSVLITHQLNPYLDNEFLRSIGRKTITRLVKPFHEIWIPDTSDRLLTGTLSEKNGAENLVFIGPLSRLNIDDSQRPNIELLAILSGPEPTRTKLEEKLVKILKGTKAKTFLIRGTDRKGENLEGIDFISLANKDQMEDKIADSKMIITRSGYSSLMDLHLLNKKKLIIPTPGQTEQEYLADHLNGKKGFIKILERDLLESTLFDF